MNVSVGRNCCMYEILQTSEFSNSSAAVIELFDPGSRPAGPRNLSLSNVWTKRFSSTLSPPPPQAWSM